MPTPSASDDTDAVTPEHSDGPDYTFEGYDVEFSRKIALTPPAAPAQRPKPASAT
jgi:hypothetical protein